LLVQRVNVKQQTTPDEVICPKVNDAEYMILPLYHLSDAVSHLFKRMGRVCLIPEWNGYF